MSLRKAAEMALEFVEWFASDDHSVRPQHKAPEVVEALRQALAQPDEVLVEREACAKVADQWDTAITDKVAEAIRARGENPPVKSYCGGKPNYCTPEVTPKVTGEVTEEVGACVTCGAPKSEWLVDAVNMTQERVDETAKREYEPVAWRDIAGKTTKFYDYNEEGRGEPLYIAPPKREWVGLDEKEISWLWFHLGNREKINGYEFAKEIEHKLKEKNT